MILGGAIFFAGIIWMSGILGLSMYLAYDFVDNLFAKKESD
jgi:hypothetical protein